jgi:hypothetical protein
MDGYSRVLQLHSRGIFWNYLVSVRLLYLYYDPITWRLSAIFSARRFLELEPLTRDSSKIPC